MKKLTSLILAMLFAVGCLSTICFAGTVVTDDTLTINGKKEYNLGSGDEYQYTFTTSLGSVKNYIFIMSGTSGTPKVTITPKSTLLNPNPSSKILTGSKSLAVIELGNLLSKMEYTIVVTSYEGKGAHYDLYIIEENNNCKLDTQPASINTATYNEDKDFAYKNGKLEFYHGEPDFTGAVYTFRDTLGHDIYTLKDNDVKQLYSEPIYEYLTQRIYYTSKVDVLRDTISYKANPNYLKSAKFTNYNNKTYHYGKDGTIKGNIFDYYYVPDVDLEGAKVVVTYKYTIDGKDQDTLDVKKDVNGWYVEIMGGKTYITNESQAENKTYTYAAPLYVGNCLAPTNIQIEKAGFFESIGIWFGVLFGKYK